MRPFGKGVPYPIPTNFNGTIEGFTIDIDAGLLGCWNFTAQQTDVVSTNPLYTRWIGTAEGGPAGQAPATGIALWEKMGPAPPGM